MIKSDLVAKIAAATRNLHPRHVEAVVEAIFDKIGSALAEEQRVELRGFGVFYVKKRPAHVGRNPRTGEIVSVEEKLSPHFKAGKTMHRRLNPSEATPSPERTK